MQNENTLEIQGGRIIVQSCDSTYANVGMVLGDKTAWRKVAIPSLTREWAPCYRADLDMSVFDANGDILLVGAGREGGLSPSQQNFNKGQYHHERRKERRR